MIILAIDTSGPVCGVAVWADGRIRYEAAAINKLTHSESLMPMLDEALTRSDVDKKELTHLAVTVGPGSFTGVRIGVTAVKALSHALNIPCIPVSALEATAAGICDTQHILCPIQDARVMQVYGAAFKDGKRLLDDCVMKLDEFIAAISPLEGDFLFTGDTLLPGSCGRSDLPTGDERTLRLSLEKIGALLRKKGPETILCTGHGPVVSAKTELARNMFLK